MGNFPASFSLRSFLASAHTVLQVWRKDKRTVEIYTNWMIVP